MVIQQLSDDNTFIIIIVIIVRLLSKINQAKLAVCVKLVKVINDYK